MRHRRHKGGLYDLVCEAELEAKLEADCTPVIVHRGQDGRSWIRPAAAFFETAEIDGVRVPS